MTDLAAPPAALELLHIPLVDIEEHPANPRHDVGDVDELAASIGQVGVLEPVLVCPAGVSYGRCGACGEVQLLDADGDLDAHRKGGRKIDCPGTGHRPEYVAPRWRLLAGHRRVKAAGQAGLQVIPALARPDIADDGHQLAAMLAENLQRVQLTPIEEAEGYDQLKLFGWSQASIAEEVGRSKATVSARLKLAKLPEKTRARLHAHELTLDVAEKLAEFADDPKLVADLERQVDGYNFNWAVQRAREDRRRAKDRARAEKKLADAGVTVIEEPDGWPHRSTAQRVLDVVGGVDEVLGDDPDLPALTEKAIADHADCPNHAAFIPDYVVRPVYVCTDPSVHPDWAERQARQLHDPDEADRDRRKAELRADLEAASAVRLTFVRDLLSGGRQIDPVPLLRRALRREVAGVYNQDRYAALLDLLGAPRPTAKSRMKQAALDLVDQVDTVAGISRVHLALAAVTAEHNDYAGTRYVSPYEDSVSSDAAAEWLGRLKEQGYELNDADRRLLPVEKAAAEEQDAGGDPDDDTEED